MSAGRPTVRKVQLPSGRWMTQEANADSRKVTGNRQPHDPAPPPDGWRITGRIRAYCPARKGADVGRVSL